MALRLLSALLVWLGLLESLASKAGLKGLSWGGGRLGLLLAAGAGLRGRPGPLALVGALPVAVGAQAGLGALRRRGLDPKLQLRPGDHGSKRIERVAIAGEHGPVPALYVVPASGGAWAVCVVHGSGCDKTFYAWRLVDELVGRGAAVLLVDLDGHGESPRPQDFPAIIESVAAPARWLAERHGKVALLGMSLGAAVAARAAAEGAPCAALALWEAPPRLRLTAEEYRRVQVREGLRIVRPTLLHLFRDGTAYHIVRAWRTSGIRARIGTWDLFDALDLLGSLGRVGGRAARPALLLVYAGRDAVLHRGSDDEVRAATEGWATFRLVRGASHVSLPIEPETIRATGAWLGAVLGAEPSGRVAGAVAGAVAGP